MSLDPARRERFFATLRDHGMAEAGDGFSIALAPQIVPAASFAEMMAFIRVFDAVAGRQAWREAALGEAPPIARVERREVCFFSAWDFHLPPEGGFQLIEFNDNGSGMPFAAMIDAFYYGAAGLAANAGIAPPATFAALRQTIGDMVEREARAFFGERPSGLLLILDDPESLSRGKFHDELRLLRALLGERGWSAEIGAPVETRWEGGRLTFDGRPVAFVVNRSTDFFFEADEFAALRQALQAGDVYIAPNPTTYATRSDKRLLEWLSSPLRDAELEIRAEERRILSAHTPESRVLREDNLEALAREARGLVFKPLHGHAGRGVLDGAEIGRERLRRLLKRGEGYVAQKRAEKARVEIDGAPVWTDLRLWAYRGEALTISGRASRRHERMDLAPPGGWIPTYVGI